MNQSDNVRLLYGPYFPPACRVGETLECEVLGREVIVGGMHDSPIPWPYRRKKGRHSLIVCGDLVRAIRVEMAKAVGYHWGVGASTVWLWRKALGAPWLTEQALALICQALDKGRETSQSLEVRAKMSAAHVHRTISPLFRERAREASKRPKLEEWKRLMSDLMKEQWASGSRRKGRRDDQQSG